MRRRWSPCRTAWTRERGWERRWGSSTRRHGCGRDALTWALTRHDASSTVDLLLDELTSTTSQARSQALHTLSKIGDRRAWPAVSSELLQDGDDEVARAAWRAAIVLVPEHEEPALAQRLSSQLGRGDREVQLSLSRALIHLADAAAPVVQRATSHPDPRVRAHALATERIARHPDEGVRRRRGRGAAGCRAARGVGAGSVKRC